MRQTPLEYLLGPIADKQSTLCASISNDKGYQQFFVCHANNLSSSFLMNCVPVLRFTMQGTRQMGRFEYLEPRKSIRLDWV
jgi:hypothetical protein